MAPQVDFYVLEQSDGEARLDFCCQLAAKIQTLGQGCVFLVEDEATARSLDQLLWQSPAESFIPHHIEGQGRATEAITISQTTHSQNSTCINLRSEPPDNHPDIQRLVEIVSQHPAVLTSTREKYRFYRQLGYPLQSHPIKAGTGKHGR